MTLQVRGNKKLTREENEKKNATGNEAKGN